MKMLPNKCYEKWDNPGESDCEPSVYTEMTDFPGKGMFQSKHFTVFWDYSRRRKHSVPQNKQEERFSACCSDWTWYHHKNDDGGS
jgi:hypothetical protein